LKDKDDSPAVSFEETLLNLQTSMKHLMQKQDELNDKVAMLTQQNSHHHQILRRWKVQ